MFFVLVRQKQHEESEGGGEGLSSMKGHGHGVPWSMGNIVESARGWGVGKVLHRCVV